MYQFAMVRATWAARLAVCVHWYNRGMNHPNTTHESKKDHQALNQQFYNQNAQLFVDGTLHVDMQSLYEPFEALTPPGAAVLDAGCGSGRDTLYFRQKGYAVQAFDASEEMVRRASAYSGVAVQRLTFETMDFNQEFDAVWACASLLHVARADIDDVFDRFDRALRPGGILYVSFKYGSREEIRNGRLFSDYTEDSFAALVQRHPAFSVERVWKTTDLRAVHAQEQWLNTLLRKTGSR
jgi:SAM-dependent methyltransferase